MHFNSSPLPLPFWVIFALLVFYGSLLPTVRGQEAPTLVDKQQRSFFGHVVDRSGNPVKGATVTLLDVADITVVTDEDGAFRLSSTVATCHLEISAPGFVTKLIHPNPCIAGQIDLGSVVLTLEGGATEVVVHATTQEVAQEQVNVELSQRILGVIPNFMVTYDPNAVPLSPKQKYKLAVRTMIDPETVGVDMLWAGVQQKTGTTHGYGAGFSGYGKQFAASYGTGSLDTLLGSAVLPSIFKQDPRYFYKGTGSMTRRTLYAVSMSVICKSDSGHWQYNYSGLLGGLAAGGLATLYEPRNQRPGVGATLENNAIGIGSSAISNLFQEFVIKKLVRKSP